MKFKYYALKIVGICTLVFLLQISMNEFTEIFVLNELAYSQIWRFLTSIFLHADISHLLYNMFALALFGSIAERIMGSKRFLILYLSSGIVANLIAINFYSSSLGASGAIYGVLGALAIIRPGMIVFAFGIPMPMIVAGVFWAVGDLIGIFIPSNVGHIAHLSGMAIGIILGFFFRKSLKSDRRITNGIILDENRMRRWEDSYLK